MNIKTFLFAVLLVGIFLIGCTSSKSGYATYNQPQGQQPQQGGQYVGGGCGVASNADYEDTPVKALNPANSEL